MKSMSASGCLEPAVDEVFDPDTADDLAHDLSVALMLVLERLSPLERAAFLLHDVFGLDFAGVAAALGRGEAACRQLAARARGHIEAGRASRRQRRRTSLGHGLPRSCGVGRRAGAGATAGRGRGALYGRRGQARRRLQPDPRRGQDLRFIAGVSRKNLALQTMHVRAATINGLAGSVMREANGSISTMAFERCAGRIAAIYVVRKRRQAAPRRTLRRRQRCRSPEVSPHSATAQRMRQLRSHQADVARAQSTGNVLLTPPLGGQGKRGLWERLLPRE